MLLPERSRGKVRQRQDHFHFPSDRGAARHRLENITPFIEFVGQEGMVTGGTGSKVRPVVSCKGTTCVFGLYDTQELAREIHERFLCGLPSM